MRPVVVFDGDCGFCRRWIRRWEIQSGGAVEFVAYQDVGGRFPGILREKFAEAIHLIEPDGRVYTGAQAVFRALRSRGGRASRWAYEKVPGFAPASEAAYRAVAARRPLFSRITLWLWGPDLEPASHDAVRWVFGRGMGLVFLAAFLSLWPQITALAGREGILPAEHLFTAARGQLGAKAYWTFPTLAWLNSSDAFLRFLCWGGAGLSFLAAAGAFQGPLLLAAWAFYLSLVTVGGDFLGFQWDNLLLEVGLVAAFLAPWGWRIFPRARASSVPLWLGRWILFRLMFESGCVKLLSGDPTWRGLTALLYHYETQPLPTWIGWYAHQLPPALHKASAAGMFFIELILPWLIFMPRRPRLAAFFGFSVLQIAIAATGNYCYFNALTLLLCVLLLDDRALAKVFPRRLMERISPIDRRPPPRSRAVWLAPLAAAQLVIGGAQLAALFTPGRAVPLVSRLLIQAAAPFRSVNSYGLFAVMTTRRLEIFLEGSEDGTMWYEYRLPWKPGDPAARPAFVAPHQPRLDWQMWFAALSSYQNTPWLTNLMVRLAQGSKDVLGLFANNPFPAGPPRYVRATAYEYHFTTVEERAATGAWWKSEWRGLYAPVLRRE